MKETIASLHNTWSNLKLLKKEDWNKYINESATDLVLTSCEHGADDLVEIEIQITLKKKDLTNG